MTDRKRDRADRQVNRLQHALKEMVEGNPVTVTYGRQPSGNPADAYRITLSDPTITTADFRTLRSALDFDALDRPTAGALVAIEETVRRVMRRRAVHARRRTGWDDGAAWPTGELYAHPLSASILIAENGGRDASPFHMATGQPVEEVHLHQDAIILHGHPVPGRPAWINSGYHLTELCLDVPLPDVLMAAACGRRLGDMVDIAPSGHADIDRAVEGLTVESVAFDGEHTHVILTPADWVVYGRSCDTTDGPFGEPYRVDGLYYPIRG